MTAGAIRFHFGRQDEFSRAVIRAWADEVFDRVKAAAGEARGLDRTMRLCRAWVAVAGTERLALDATRMADHRAGHDGARGMFLRVLEEWIEHTHRSLREAKDLGELRRDVDLRAFALELHLLAWGHAWASTVYGEAASARFVLEAIWHRLFNVAADSVRLPPLDEFAGPKKALPEPRQRPMTPAEAFDEPMWKTLLDPWKPLYHAFVRHERMGDHRNFLNAPEVLPEDVAEAEAWVARHGRPPDDD